MSHPSTIAEDIQAPPKKSATRKTSAGRTKCATVGIGASAGGLEAFRRLLEHLPTDTGLAFVLVQRLDSAHESILAELLSKSTRMPVSEVAEGLAVEPDHCAFG